MSILGISINTVRGIFLKDEVEERASPENPSTSLSNPSGWLSNLFSGSSSSGVSVTQDTALAIAAVWRAVHLISEGIAGLQGQVLKDDKDGNKKTFPSHRVLNQLRSPSLLYTGFTFKQTLTALAVLKGNGIAKINKDGTFSIINSYSVSTIFENGILVYKYIDEYGKSQVVESSQVLHIPALVMDIGTPLAKSPLTVFRETLGLDIAQTRYSSRFFKNGTHIDGFLSTDQKISSEGLKRMGESWRARFGGVENVGSTPVLEEGVKYVPLSLNPQDAMFVESRGLSVQEVARIFGVPLHMLSSLDRATFSNIEHQSREFVVYSLRSWVKKWEEEVNRKLFTESEKRRGFYYRFNMDSLHRGDSESRGKLYDTYMKWGIANRDEIRRMEGWNDSKDDSGKKHFVPVNMMPADKIGEAGQQQQIPFPDEKEEENED